MLRADMHHYFQNYINAVEHPLPEMSEYFDAENKYLKSLVSLESTVLDVGCGNGRTMEFLAPHVKEIVGIDYDTQMIKAARLHLKDIDNTELVEADFLSFEFGNKFDLVYGSYNLLGSAETKDREAMLGRMFSFTEPGGHIINSVWSDEGIEFARKYYSAIGIQVNEIAGTSVVTDHGTFRRFSKKELEELALRLGFLPIVIRLTPIFYLMDLTK
jgi:ubiquinone/menaquinone biosynthesis C-methylase UbiE